MRELFKVKDLTQNISMGRSLETQREGRRAEENYEQKQE